MPQNKPQPKTQYVNLLDLPSYSSVFEWINMLHLYNSTSSESIRTKHLEYLYGLDELLSEYETTLTSLNPHNFKLFSENQKKYLSERIKGLQEEYEQTTTLEEQTRIAEQLSILNDMKIMKPNSYYDYYLTTLAIEAKHHTGNRPKKPQINVPTPPHSDSTTAQQVYIKTAEKILPMNSLGFDISQGIHYSLETGKPLPSITPHSHELYKAMQKGFLDYSLHKNVDQTEFDNIQKHAYQAIGRTQALIDVLDVMQSPQHFDLLRRYQIYKLNKEKKAGSRVINALDASFQITELWSGGSYNDLIALAYTRGLITLPQKGDFQFPGRDIRFQSLLTPALINLNKAESEYAYLSGLYSEMQEALKQDENLKSELLKIDINPQPISLGTRLLQGANTNALITSSENQLIQPKQIVGTTIEGAELAAFLVATNGLGIVKTAAVGTGVVVFEPYQTAKESTISYLSSLPAIQALATGLNSKEINDIAYIAQTNQSIERQVEGLMPSDDDLDRALQYAKQNGCLDANGILEQIIEIRSKPLSEWEKERQDLAEQIAKKEAELATISDEINKEKEKCPIISIDGVDFPWEEDAVNDAIRKITDLNTIKKKKKQPSIDESELTEFQRSLLNIAQERQEKAGGKSLVRILTSIRREYQAKRNDLIEQNKDVIKTAESIEQKEQEKGELESKLADSKEQLRKAELAIRCLKDGRYFSNVIAYTKGIDLSKSKEADLLQYQNVMAQYDDLTQTVLKDLITSSQQLHETREELNYREQLVTWHHQHESSTRQKSLEQQSSEQRNINDNQSSEKGSHKPETTLKKEHQETAAKESVFNNPLLNQDFTPITMIADNSVLRDDWEKRILFYCRFSRNSAWIDDNIGGLREGLNAYADGLEALTLDNFKDYQRHRQEVLTKRIASEKDIEDLIQLDAEINRLSQATNYADYGNMQGWSPSLRPTIVPPDEGNKDNIDQVYWTLEKIQPTLNKRTEMVQSIAFALETGRPLKKGSHRLSSETDYDYRNFQSYHRALGYAHTYRDAIETISSTPMGRVAYAYALSKAREQYKQAPELAKQAFERLQEMNQVMKELNLGTNEKTSGKDKWPYFIPPMDDIQNNNQSRLNKRFEAEILRDAQYRLNRLEIFGSLTMVAESPQSESCQKYTLSQQSDFSFNQLKKLEDTYNFFVDSYNEFLKELEKNPELIQQYTRPEDFCRLGTTQYFYADKAQFERASSDNIEERILKEQTTANDIILQNNNGTREELRSKDEKLKKQIEYARSNASDPKTQEQLDIALEALTLRMEMEGNPTIKDNIQKELTGLTEKYEVLELQSNRSDIDISKIQKDMDTCLKQIAIYKGALTGNYFYYASGYIEGRLPFGEDTINSNACDTSRLKAQQYRTSMLEIEQQFRHRLEQYYKIKNSDDDLPKSQRSVSQNLGQKLHKYGERYRETDPSVIIDTNQSNKNYSMT